ncbi:hypothetical protein [Asticcacaulis solisilvae]|uniref:hypothetical protein n=1 Tax=Asticcacaulis solisilvae TaxID=1217274 RepID=UPI003FD8EC04
MVTIVSANPDGLVHQAFVDKNGHSITRYLDAKTGQPLGDVDLTTGGSWRLNDGATRIRVDILPAGTNPSGVQIMTGADVLAYLSDKESYDWGKTLHNGKALDRVAARSDFMQLNQWVDYLSGIPDQPGYDFAARQRVTGTGGRLYQNAVGAGLIGPDRMTQSFVDFGVGAQQYDSGGHPIMGRTSMGFGPLPETPIPVSRPSYLRGPYLFANQSPGDLPRSPEIIPTNRLTAMEGRKLIYVIKKDGTLLVARNRGATGHIDLADGKPVLSAGQFRMRRGDIEYIDNDSGHYRPYGPSAGDIAEAAFRKLGYDAEGKYIERKF